MAAIALATATHSTGHHSGDIQLLAGWLQRSGGLMMSDWAKHVGILKTDCRRPVDR